MLELQRTIAQPVSAYIQEHRVRLLSNPHLKIMVSDSSEPISAGIPKYPPTQILL